MFLFSRFGHVAKVAIIDGKDIAKFGYIQNMFYIFWLSPWTMWRNLMGFFQIFQKYLNSNSQKSFHYSTFFKLLISPFWQKKLAVEKGFWAFKIRYSTLHHLFQHWIISAKNKVPNIMSSLVVGNNNKLQNSNNILSKLSVFYASESSSSVQLWSRGSSTTSTHHTHFWKSLVVCGLYVIY